MSELVRRKKRKHRRYTAALRRRIPLGLRILLSILVVVLVLFMTLAAVFHTMRLKGKKSLYNRAQSNGPALPGLSGMEGDLFGGQPGESMPDSWNFNPIGGPGDDFNETSAANKNPADPVGENGDPAGTGTNNGSDHTNHSSAYGSQNAVDPYEPQAGDVGYKGHIYRYNSDILTFLLLGIDSTETVPTDDREIDYMKGGQSDMMFLAVMNPHTKELSLVAINRNTMTDIDMYRSDGSFLRTAKAQICVQHGYGDGKELSCERAMQTVSDMLYGLPIHGYCSIRLGGIMEVNNSVGGVTLTVQDDYEPLGLRSGETVTLDADDAYAFLRRRDITVFDSATARLNRQKLYLSALLKEIKEHTASDLRFPVTLYRKLSPYMVTNIGIDEVTYLASELTGYSVGKAKMYTLPGQTIRGRVFEEFYLDETAVVEMMLQIFYDVVK